MSRLWSYGAELQSTVAGTEADTFTGTTSISTAVKRSGAASLRCNPTAGTGFVSHTYRAASTVRTFFRAYVRFDTLPSADCALLANSDLSSNFPSIWYKASGTCFQGKDGTPMFVGSTSGAITTGVWYRLELDFNDASGDLMNIYIDGTQICTNVNGGDLGGSGAIRFGIISPSVTADAYFDDVAVNDSIGSVQTGLPGAGSIVHLYPNAAGDANGWATAVGGTAGAANNFTRVAEVSPDDITTYNQTTVTGTTTIDDFNVTDAATAGIGAGDTITLVQVGHRHGSSATTTASVVTRLKGQAAGTLLESASLPVNINGWRTHANAVPKTHRITAYVNPQGSVAWTVSAINSMQIGYRGNVSQTAVRRMSSIWALVEYVPASTTHVSQTLDVRWRTLNKVAQTLDARWKVSNIVSKSVDLRWAVRSTVAQSTDLRWAVRSVVSKPVDFRWITRNLVSKAIDLRWTSYARASQTLDARWNVRNTVTNSVDYRWRSLNLVSTATDIRWRTLNRVAGAVDYRWQVRNAVQRAVDYRWAVRASVSGSLDFRWAVRNKVTSTLDLRWAVRSVVAASLDARWIVRATVSTGMDLRWIVRSSVASPIEFVWVSGGTAIHVSRALDLRWTVRNVVAAPLDVRWALRMGVSGSLDLRWAQRAVASRSLDLRWTAAGRIASSLAVVWAVRGATAGTLDLRWVVRSQISRPLDARWRVLHRVPAGLQLLWIVDGSAQPIPADVIARLTQRFSVTPELVGFITAPTDRLLVPRPGSISYRDAIRLGTNLTEEL